MLNIRSYLLSICGAAIVCSVITTLTGEKSGPGKLIKLLSGVFFSLVILNPVLHTERMDWKRFEYYIHDTCESAVAEGEQFAMEEMINGVQEKTQEVIASEGAKYGCQISASVTCEGYMPRSVVLEGAISPYARKALTAWIADNIGIPEEDQLWIG